MKNIKNKEPVDKKLITEYVSVTIPEKQVIDNYVASYGIPSDGYDFNQSWVYSSLGFCTLNEANSFFDKLDFHKFQEVLNFVNKKWGWKIFSIIPIIVSERGYNYTTPKTASFLYTFYREIEK